MSVDLDTEDRVVRYRMAMWCVMDLLDWQNMECPRGVQPHRLSMLLHIMHEEFDRAHPQRPTPCKPNLRAVEDVDIE